MKKIGEQRELIRKSKNFNFYGCNYLGYSTLKWFYSYSECHSFAPGSQRIRPLVNHSNNWWKKQCNRYFQNHCRPQWVWSSVEVFSKFSIPLNAIHLCSEHRVMSKNMQKKYNYRNKCKMCRRNDMKLADMPIKLLTSNVNSVFGCKFWYSKCNSVKKFKLSMPSRWEISL